MDKSWNDFELKKPPFLTLPSTRTKFVAELHNIIETYVSKHAANQDEFNETAALLGRLMARRKNSFQKMKGFKDICKLNAALCRLLRVDFERDLESFRSSLPDVIYEEGTLIHLPTRDTYDFLLVRLIAVCELFKRIVDCCLDAAEYFTSQLKMYFFFEINTLMLAVVAKIYNFSINLGNLAINFYNRLHGYRLELPSNEKSKFFENSTELPIQIESIRITKIAELNQEKSTELAESPIAELLKQEQQIMPRVKAKCLKKIDLGKTIARSNAKKSFDLEDLKTVPDVKQFIIKENADRAKNPKTCLSKHILSHEWKGATKLFERKVENGEEKKAINIFKKFIGSKMTI